MCLVPFIDFLNHSPAVSTEVRFDGSHVGIATKTGVRKGEEVLINYGAHGNAALVSYYGFAVPGNAQDKIRVDRLVAQEAESWEEKRVGRRQKEEHLEKLIGMRGPAEEFFMFPGGEVSWNTIAFLRISLMDASELGRGLEERVPEDRAVSLANEERVRGVILSVCSRLIGITAVGMRSSRREIRILAEGHNEIARSVAERFERQTMKQESDDGEGHMPKRRKEEDEEKKEEKKKRKKKKEQQPRRKEKP